MVKPLVSTQMIGVRFSVSALNERRNVVDIFSTNLAMQLRFAPLVKIGPNDLGDIVPGRRSTTANPELEAMNLEREFKKQVRENLKEERQESQVQR